VDCPDWKKIKAEYIAGGTSYRKLAEKYGVSRSKLQAIATREKWVDLQSQAQAKAESIIVNDIGKKSAKIDDKYFRLVDMLFDKAEEVIVNTPMWSANTLKEMSTAMKYLKECKGVKSEADIREQEARIRNLEKQAEAEEKDNEIKVIIENDIEEYSK
jgi:lambda repressor-like predicted transcriptional regulator